jgi:hypothetical protein
MVVPLAQITAAFPPVSQVHSVFCPGVSYLHLLCSLHGSEAVFRASTRQHQRAATSTPLLVWMDSHLGSPSER